jgi:hypothetical protein
MSDRYATRIRVIRPEDIRWQPAKRYPEETDPPGEEFTAATSADDKFSFGLWRRAVQRRHFERQYHEVAFILEGEVEITDDDGEVLVAGPGDIVVTPLGCTGYWKNLTPVKKVWAAYEEAGADLKPYLGPGAF